MKPQQGLDMVPLEVALAGFQLRNLETFYQDVTTRKPRREPTLMDLIVAAHINSEKDDKGPTRRWFLKRGLSIGAIAFMAVFPGAPVFAAGATIFVDSTATSASDANDGSRWTFTSGTTGPKATIAGGIAGAGIGDFVLVSSAQSFTATAAITYTPPAGGLAIISVTPSGTTSYSAFTTGAAESVGAASAAFTLAAAAGSAMYLSGLVLTSGTNAAAACVMNFVTTATGVGGALEAINCSFSIPATNTAAWFAFGQPSSVRFPRGRFTNCTFAFGSRAGNNGFQLQNGIFEIINPTLTFGATKPSALIGGVLSEGGGVMTIRDGDISSYTAGGYVDLQALFGSVILVNLITHATPTITINTMYAGSSASVTTQNVGSGNTDYTFQYTNGAGTLTADAGVYKNGGFTFNGTNVSWKIVTTAACSEFNPFRTPLFQIWDTTNTSQTGTISIAQASGATGLTDRNCWINIDFSASPGTTTKYTNQSSRNTQPFVGTGTTWTTDTATWTGISTPVVQLIDTGAFTAARDGLLRGQLAVGIASTTLYADAKFEGIT